MEKIKGDEMENINRVLTAMQPMCIYRPKDLDIDLSVDECRRILKKLAKGMVVEVIETGEYGRKFLYQTKQERLF
jgi:hypothetical protein